MIGINPKEVLSELKDISEKLFDWFFQSEIKANHMLLSTPELLNFQISEAVHNLQWKKVLRVTFGSLENIKIQLPES